MLPKQCFGVRTEVSPDAVVFCCCCLFVFCFVSSVHIYWIPFLMEGPGLGNGGTAVTKSCGIFLFLDQDSENEH